MNIARHMSSVEAYRQRLATLQGSWDTLSLLSHLAADSSDMSGTRQAFEALAADLVNSLTIETHRKSLLALKAKSQIAIDILVRNLYERTADIGFLSADQDLRDYVRDLATPSARANDEQWRKRKDALHSRLRAYVAKYSVYCDIALLADDGEILLKLQPTNCGPRTDDSIVADSMRSQSSYVETYRRIDFFPQHERSLVYSHKVGDRAVLCLSFDLQDEVRRIFTKLVGEDDWGVYAFVDADGSVICSNDPWQLPEGAKVPLAMDEGGRIVRFAGREYLATTRRTPGYQGYAGPGWYGHAMIPLEHAFDQDSDADRAHLSESVLKDLSDSETLFTTELRKIPHQARRIQEELNRSVWNGNVRLSSRAETGSDFAKALLREIGNAGRRTQETFEHSIADLQGTVASAISHNAQLLARLSVDIVDRNLYERANDCRWWALNATLIEHLAARSRNADRVTEVLRHINSLYTVYHGIVLFDAEAHIVAVSNAVHDTWIGKQCTEQWVSATLALRDPQSFAVSDFVPSELYENRPTLIFGAVLSAAGGGTLGGIGIVFDTAPQLEAMLKDALPRAESGAVAEGCIGLYVDTARRVIAATSIFQPGEIADLPAKLFAPQQEAGSRIVEYRGVYYAACTCATSGYREYAGLGATGIVMVPLGPRPARRKQVTKALSSPAKRNTAGEQSIEIATFFCAGQWLGLLRDHIVEAIDASSLRSMPGKPAWHAGIVMYQGTPTPVVDMARLTGVTADRAAREIIVVQAASHRSRIGLLVDELASIPEVPATSLLPLSDCAAGNGLRIVDRAVRPDHAEDPVLLIVNIEQLLMAIKEEKRLAVSG